jgi:ketosteroid isomerase-like protein
MIGRLLAACALAGAVVALTTGCGVWGSASASSASAATQREADLYQIDQIERTFHRAGSHHDVKLLMTLFAPGAVFNLGTQTLTGKAQIRKYFATQNPAFQSGHDWESDTPSYKVKETVNGDKGTLYFECHYVDVKTGKVMAIVGVNHAVQKIDGKWLIVDSASATPILSP